MKFKQCIMYVVGFSLIIPSFMFGMMRRVTPTTSTRIGRGIATTMGVNPYQVLGVPSSSSLAEVKKRYRELSLKYHPDVQDSGNAEKFRQVNEAFELIRARGDFTNKGRVDVSQEPVSEEPFSQEPVREVRVEEQLLEHLQKHDLNSVIALANMLSGEGKINIKSFMVQAQPIIAQKLLQILESRPGLFFASLDKIVDLGFDTVLFVDSNRQKLVELMVKHIGSSGSDYQYSRIAWLKKSLKYSIFVSLEDFIQHVAAITLNKSVLMSIKSKLLGGVGNFQSLIYNLLDGSVYTPEDFKLSMDIYTILVSKGYVAVLVHNDPIQQKISKVLFELFVYRIKNVKDDNFGFGYNIQSLIDCFACLRTCVDQKIVSREPFLESLHHNFETMIADLYMTSREKGDYALKVLLQQGVKIEAPSQQSSFDDVRNKFMQNLQDGKFDEASRLWNSVLSKEHAEDMKHIILNQTLGSLHKHHARGLAILMFALKHNIISLDTVIHAEQFLSQLSTVFILELFKHCSKYEDYVAVADMVILLDQERLFDKKQIVSGLTELIITQNKQHFRENEQNGAGMIIWFEKFIKILKYLQTKELINHHEIHYDLAAFLSAQLLDMLIVKNATPGHYQYVLDAVKLAIKERYFTLQDFLQRLFNSSGLSLEEKERFKALLINA